MKRTRLIASAVISAGIILVILMTVLIRFPAEKSPVWKVGVLVANDQRLTKVEGLKSELQQLGYSEGAELKYHIENAQNDLQRMDSLGDLLLKEKPDVLVAAGAVEAQTLQEVTANNKVQVPIVFMGTLSPVDIGLVQNLSQPGGNLTGLNNYHFELTPKRLELLHRLLPKVKKVAVLGDTRVPVFTKTQEELNKVAQVLGLSVQMYTVMNSGEIQQAFESVQTDQMEAIILLPGFFLESSTPEIINRAKLSKLPVFGVYPQDTEEGCLASYGTSNREQGVQSAHMVSKILRGYKPNDIPVETPDHIVFSVNLKAAQELGIHPSPSILSLADQVIQP
ncbi:ABC transporter substrate-binding protein [Desulfitobacterium sp. Sab5]|uniref:ABC transporter substrate-binding protein n=1 Tax=Desulfitobacterium nosdiversum TaxID=3375356 RepID=UPI003CF424AC